MQNKQTLKRREFLIPMIAVGTGVLLHAIAGPIHVVAQTVAGKEPLGGGRPVRLNTTTLEDFSDLVGQTFRLRQQHGSMVNTRLIEATRLTAKGKKRRRQPFSLVFDVPDGIELTQGQYGIRHRRLGALELFMVPVDLPARYNRLEAIVA